LIPALRRTCGGARRLLTHTKINMKLIQQLEKPIQRFWNKSAKSRFEWTIEGLPKTDAKGQFIRIGSYDANFWFHISLGKTEKATLLNARRYIAARNASPCTFEIVE